LSIMHCYVRALFLIMTQWNGKNAAII